jgi:hypothetical protein
MAVTKAEKLVFRGYFDSALCKKKPLQLCAMLRSAEFLNKFYLRLRAIQIRVTFKPKIFFSTPRYAA